MQAGSDVLFGITLTIGALVFAEAAAMAGLLGINWFWQPLAIILGIGLSFQYTVGPYIKLNRQKLYREVP